MDILYIKTVVVPVLFMGPTILELKQVCFPANGIDICPPFSIISYSRIPEIGR
jgi:hypothetical protein